MEHSKRISCLIVDDESVARAIIASHLSHFPHVDIKGNCSSALEAFDLISRYDIDLIFLDINMPEISGISFAKSINPNIKIIFTTAYRDYAVEGFELRAVDYLLKPISLERLERALNTFESSSSISLKTKVTASDIANFMFVRSDRKMIKIDYDHIIYIESYSDYLKIHLKEQTIVTRETISAIEAKLPKHRFLRIHRSYVISVQHIESFTNEYIVISEKSLPISRSYKKEVLKHLEHY